MNDVAHPPSHGHRSSGSRPALLTLFALLQFVLAFAVFQGVFAPSMFRELPDDAIETSDQATRALRDAYRECSDTQIATLSLLSGLQTVLAIVSGIGLLRRHPRFGRGACTLYALTVPASTLLTHQFLRDAYTAAALDFWPRHLVLLVHALVLLLVVHGAMRHQFVRPTRAASIAG